MSVYFIFLLKNCAGIGIIKYMRIVRKIKCLRGVMTDGEIKSMRGVYDGKRENQN